MLYALGVLIFAVGLLASIALHEVGHMVPAKKFGVKVTQYMVGFGPTCGRASKGDTEYGVKAVPLGGYIRMIGMVPPRADGTRSRWPRRMATAVEEFRQVSRAEVEPGDEDRQFYRLTPGKKMIVMLGGPTMNLLIYLVLTVHPAEHARHAARRRDHDGQRGREVRRRRRTRRQAANNSCPANATPRARLRRAAARRRHRARSTARRITNWDDAVAIIEQLGRARPLSITVQRNGDRTARVDHAGAQRQVRQRQRHEDQGQPAISASSPQIHSYYAAAAGDPGTRPDR